MCGSWQTLYADGDGDCAWRALAQGIWGSQEFWAQLKLFVLAWFTASAESLVGEGGIPYNGAKYWSQEEHAKYGKFSKENEASGSEEKLRCYWLTLRKIQREEEIMGW